MHPTACAAIGTGMGALKPWTAMVTLDALSAEPLHLDAVDRPHWRRLKCRPSALLEACMSDEMCCASS